MPGPKVSLARVCLEPIRVSAEEGCQYYRLFRDITESYIPGRDGKHSIVIATGRFTRFTTKLLWGDEKGQSTSVMIYGADRLPLDGVRGTAVPPSVETPEINGDTSSPEAIGRIRDLVSQCDNTHAKCAAQLSSNGHLPTRVLDLQAPDTPDSIRLYKPEGEKGSYACLSHCSGAGNNLLKTETRTFPAHEGGHFGKGLAQNIQRGGIRYTSARHPLSLD
jgi:hypothetical protein